VNESSQTVEDIVQTLQSIESTRATPSYTQTSAPGIAIESAGVVRLAHALAVVERPDAVREYEFDDLTFFAAVKEVSVDRGDFALLAFGKVEKGIAAPTFAFRVYPDEDNSLEDIAAAPSLALALVLKRYCLTYPAREGAELVHFVPVRLIPKDLAPKPGHADVARALDIPLEHPGHDYDAEVNVSVLIPSGAEPTKLLFPFKFDRRGYLADLRRRGVI
jgi:hypothetical protein